MSDVSDEVSALAQVRRGRLFIQDRRTFDERVARLDERWQLEVSVKRLRATRNQQQSRWYWGVIVHMVSEYTGHTPDELHDLFKQKFIPKRLAICDGNGEVVDELVVGGSTRKMNTKDFAEYCDAIRQWAAETLNVAIPDPDPEWRTTEQELSGHGWGV